MLQKKDHRFRVSSWVWLLIFSILTGFSPSDSYLVLENYSPSEDVIPHLSNLNQNPNNYSDSSLMPLSGDINDFPTQLFIEQLNVEIDGNTGILHHSVLTNQTNSLYGMELDNPIFDGVSFCICQTNGQDHPFSLNSLTSFSEIAQLQTYPLVGFFFLDHEKIHYNPDEGIDFLSSTFEAYFMLDFKFMKSIQNETHSLYPFFANPLASPNDQLNSMETRLRSYSLDGYFRYLSLEEIDFFSESYYGKYFFEEDIIFLDNLKAVSQIQYLIKQNYEQSSLSDKSPFYFDFVDILEQNSIYAGLSSLYELFSTLNGTEQIKNPDGPCNFADQDITARISISEDLDILDYAKQLILYDLAIEMPKSAISKNQNIYTFDLKKSLNLSSDWIFSPSYNSYSSPSGWLSGISATLHAATVENIFPSVLPFSRVNIAPIEDLLFDENQNGWHEIFQNYQFHTQFYQEAGISKLYLFPEKIHDVEAEFSDIVEYLLPLSIPVLSGILLGDLSNFMLNFSQIESPPNLQVYKTLQGGSFSDLNPTLGNLPATGIDSINATISFDIELKNVGNLPVWGLPVRIHDFLGFPNSPPNTQLTKIIRNLGYDIESMFSSEIPRFFPIDAFGQGYYSSYSPDLFKINNLQPYSPQFAQTIEENFDYLLSNSIYSEKYLNDSIEKYQNQNSLYNPKNWYISPGESRKLTVTQDLLNISYISHQNSNYDQVNLTYEIAGPATVKYCATSKNINILRSQSNAILIVKNHSTIENNPTSLENISVIQATAVLISKIPSQTPTNNIVTHNISVFNIGNFLIFNLSICLPEEMRTSLENPDFQYLEYENSSQLLPTYNLMDVPQNITISNILYQSWKYRIFNGGSAKILLDWNESILLTRNKPIKTPENLVFGTNSIDFSQIGDEGESSSSYATSFLKIETEIMKDDNDIQLSQGNLYVLNYTIYNLGNIPLSNISQPFMVGNIPTDEMIIEDISSSNIESIILMPGKSIVIQFTLKILHTKGSLVPMLFLKTDHGEYFKYSMNHLASLATPQIEIKKVVNRKAVLKGSAIEVLISVKNTGDCVLTDIFIQESELVKSENFLFLNGNLTVNIPTLNPGQEYLYSYRLSTSTLGKLELPPNSAHFIFDFLQFYESNSVSMTVFPTKFNLGLGGLSFCAIFLIFQANKRWSWLKSLHKYSI
ncbi:hypothetical protein [Candidatus Lokiarchaeum ossiferum]|uniref:hypothetical protein n=1 Tax=Candidatus Lokiarchaeum ossiferum TaxID=2951803 RepID=UPI00352E5921